MPIPAFMILCVLSDSVVVGAGLFLPVGGWALTPGLPRVWCSPRAVTVKARWWEKSSPCPAAPAGGLHLDRTEIDQKRALQGSCPLAARAEHSCCSRHSRPPLQHPQTHPLLCERETASQGTSGVCRQRWVLCCLSSAWAAESSGCKRRPPWPEALLSASAPPARVRQIWEVAPWPAESTGELSSSALDHILKMSC